MADELKIPTPAPADRPSFKISADGNQISGEFQIKGIIVNREFNRVASADIVILDGDPATQDFKASNDEAFKPGVEIEISAGYHGNEEVIFKGIIIRHSLRVHKSQQSYLKLECRDAAVKMTIGPKSAYFYDSLDSDVIEELAGNAGLETDIESTDVTHPFIVQFYATDWDFALARAQANGKLIVTQDGSLVAKAPDPSGDPVLSLAYGGNVLDIEMFVDARDQFSAMQSLSWDPANQEMFEIDAVDPGATTPGNLQATELADVIGLDAYKLKHGGAVKDDELQAWADAKWMSSAYSKVRGRVKVQGVSAVKPGDLIEIKGMGDRFNGQVLVSGVHHEINDKNWETDIQLGLSPEYFEQLTKDPQSHKASGLLPGLSGLQLGLVTSLEDPDGEHRIQVRTPMIDPSEEGIWARVATLDAGENRGSFFLPEIGDEVALGFLNDDPRHPVVLGMLHSSAKPAPLEATDDNHEKGYVSRSEMKLIFNDDKNTVTLETPNGNSFLFSDDEGSITFTDENGNEILMNSDGISLTSAADINLTASGDVNIEGTNISPKASAEFKAEGSSSAEVSSGGTMTVKGSLVQIN